MSIRTLATDAIRKAGRRVPRLGAILSAASGKAPRTVVLSSAPPKTILHQASVRTYSDWSPASLRAAETSADCGQLRQAAMLCEDMLGDDRIQGCLQEVRVRGLLGLDLTFEPGLGRGRGKAVRFLEAEEDWDVAFPDYALCELFTWGVLLGVGPAWNDWQLLERPSGGKRQIPVLQNWHAQNLRQDIASGKWYAKQADGSEREVVPGDGTWVLHTPYGLSRPWARGSWRALSRWFLLKRFAIADWGRYSERHGMGLFAGIAPDGANPKDRDALAADLAAMARDSEIVLPPGYDLKLVESTANTWTTFKAQIDMANLGTAINLLGQNLSTEVQGGSYAAVKALGSVKNSILKADAWSGATTLHDQSIVFWAEYNQGARKVAPWPIWGTELPEDLKAKADTFDVAGRALVTWQAAGAPVDVQQYAQDFNLPVKEDQEPKTPEPPKPPAPSKDEPPSESPAGNPANAVALASGDSGAGANGFVNGQTYADSLAATTRDQAAAALSPWIDEVMAIVDHAEGFESLKTALAEAYPEMQDDEFENLTARALVLAELAGNFAVLEDV